MILKEINERFCADMWGKFTGDWDKIDRMSIFSHNQVKMANLSVIASHKNHKIKRDSISSKLCVDESEINEKMSLLSIYSCMYFFLFYFFLTIIFCYG